jgi:hypothetical protein
VIQRKSLYPILFLPSKSDALIEYDNSSVGEEEHFAFRHITSAFTDWQVRCAPLAAIVLSSTRSRSGLAAYSVIHVNRCSALWHFSLSAVSRIILCLGFHELDFILDQSLMGNIYISLFCYLRLMGWLDLDSRRLSVNFLPFLHTSLQVSTERLMPKGWLLTLNASDRIDNVCDLVRPDQNALSIHPGWTSRVSHWVLHQYRRCAYWRQSKSPFYWHDEFLSCSSVLRNGK